MAVQVEAASIRAAAEVPMEAAAEASKEQPKYLLQYK